MPGFKQVATNEEVKNWQVKPCPFCGAEMIYIARFLGDNGYWRHPKSDCFIPYYDDIDNEAKRDHWNKRVDNQKES